MTSCEAPVFDRYGLQVFWKRRRGRDKLMAEIRRAGIVHSEPVLEAIERVERRHFVRPDDASEAYDNAPLPIGRGQTISQPLVVALMSEALAIGSGDRVLEVGTGSGYQAAVLAEMGAQVYSVEIIPALSDWAAANLRCAGYRNIELDTADGFFGWEEHAPYDAIIVTAAASRIPRPLIPQLRVGGRLVVPVGSNAWDQTLWVVERTHEGETSTNLGPVRFVPLTGDGQSAAG
ncbi:MAG: protein-L-isoaspartate(D-aspartate) O-methyltransferase [Chloroflexota bacterium]|nr:protein-L-isoaspartate(D-aspartate) O-methyltransferase [Chloroflexota bacterium]